MVDPAQVIKLAIGVSILLLVFSLGMGATFADATSFLRTLFRPPRQLLRATLAMNVVVPAIAIAAVALFDMPKTVSVALLAMAVSPVPPILPGKEMKFGGRPHYVFGLLVAVSLTAIVLTPLTVGIMGRILDRELHIGMVDIAKLVARTILLPLTVGMLFRKVAPNLADRLSPLVSKIAFGILILGLLPVLYTAWPGIRILLGNGTGMLIVGVAMAAVAAGHWIGGPDEHDRTALGIASAMRHPGIAMSIATTNFPEDKSMPAGILLYVLIAAVVTSIYGKLRLRRVSNVLASSAHRT
ncbi:MAG TPA: hypothetical protein VEX68_30165 [Bryobacteraceae bacterium]|nr:hypothetical protein [Bryobacteraceae bacterium]